MKKEGKILRQVGKGSILLLCCAALVGLALLAYLGFYNRYWADDWCYNRDIKSMGVVGSLQGYFFTGPGAIRGYSTNRYSLTLLSGLFYLPGVLGTQIIATVIIILWMGGLLWTLSNLSGFYRPLSWCTALLSTAFLIYFTIYFSPQRFQILYWRSGVHYSFTIITGIYLLALITTQMAREHPSRTVNYVVAPLAFFGGGLSETGCVYLFTSAILLLAAAWVGKRKHWAWAERSLPTLLVVVLALLVAMLALIVSPSNDRYHSMAVKSTSLVLVPWLSIRFSLDFIYNSFKSLPLPHLIFITTFAALAVLQEILSPVNESVSLQKKSLLLIAIGLITFLLIASIQAPSVYFYSSTPEPRAQSLSRFTMLIGLAMIARQIGQMTIQKWRSKWIFGLAILCMGLSTLYIGRLILANYRDLPGFDYRAQLWDNRDAAIQAARAQGLNRIDVLVIDMKGLGVQDIMPSKEMNGQWVNNCASQYYGADAIRAVSVLRNPLKSIQDSLTFGSCFIEHCRISRSYTLSTGVTSRGTRGSRSSSGR